jgi:hypothetical protein
MLQIELLQERGRALVCEVETGKPFGSSKGKKALLVDFLPSIPWSGRRWVETVRNFSTVRIARYRTS